MTMTNREFLNAVINANVSEEISTHAQEMLQKLDARNSARASKPSKTATENKPIKAKILNYLTEVEKAFASEVGIALDISTNKASALCRQLVLEGLLKVEDVSVPKKGKLKSYSLV